MGAEGPNLWCPLVLVHDPAQTLAFEEGDVPKTRQTYSHNNCAAVPTAKQLNRSTGIPAARRQVNRRLIDGVAPRPTAEAHARLVLLFLFLF